MFIVKNTLKKRPQHFVKGRTQTFVPEGLTFLNFPGGLNTRWGLKTPWKPWGDWAPYVGLWTEYLEEYKILWDIPLILFRLFWYNK